jgi:predicted phosphodiesterase
MPTEPQPTHAEGAVVVITDIHANLPALQAALARVDELGIKRVYCGGDLVGYGPHPIEVEDKPASLYERLAAGEEADVLVFGHTHKPWVHEYGGVLFVNCGSVGKPKDGDPRGAFAILRPAAGTVDVTIERTAYDVEAVADEVRAAGLPAEFADKLLAGA